MTDGKKDGKKRKQHSDELRDDITRAFRKCKIPMNRTSLNKYAVMYIKANVSIKDFSRFVEGVRDEEQEVMDIETAYAQEGGVIISPDEDYPADE